MKRIFLTNGVLSIFTYSDITSIVIENGYSFTSIKEKADLFIFSPETEKDIIDYCIINNCSVTYDAVFLRNLKYIEQIEALNYISNNYQEDDRYYLNKIALSMFDNYGYGSVADFKIYDYKDIEVTPTIVTFSIFTRDIFEVDL